MTKVITRKDIIKTHAWFNVQIEMDNSIEGSVIDVGQTIGKLEGKDIPAWVITTEGKKYDFTGATQRTNKAVITKKRLVLPPGMLYLEVG